MTDKPITPAPNHKVVNINKMRLARGFTKRPYRTCKHMDLTYDTSERRIWCNDCEQNIEAFDVVVTMADHIGNAWAKINRAETEVAEAVSHNIRLIAARAMDKEWQSRSMVPCCPHCSRGLLPDDFRSGARGRVSKKLEVERRKKEADK